MCGIGAFHIRNAEVQPAKVARVLLRLLEQRGKDASGVAWHEQGQTFICKTNINGASLAKQLDANIGTTGIVHTRWATQGSPENNDNNHPLDVGGIVGVHNGHISNDNELLSLCENYKRCAQVDSEAVFALLAHANELTLADKTELVRGSAALLWLESHDETETLHAMRLNSSPLVFGQTAFGSVVFASTRAILTEVGRRCDMQFEYMHEVEEGTYLRVRNGMVTHMDKVPTAPAYSLLKHDYSKASKYSAPTPVPYRSKYF